MKRALVMLSLLLVTIGVGVPSVAAARTSRAPAFVEMHGFEGVNCDAAGVPTDVSFGALVYVRNVNVAKGSYFEVTFTVRFDVGGQVTRTNRVSSYYGRFGAADTDDPIGAAIAIPDGATVVTVDAVLVQVITKTGVATTVAEMSSGPQRVYTLAEVRVGGIPTEELFLVFPD